MPELTQSQTQNRRPGAPPPDIDLYDEHSSLVHKLESLSLLSGGVAHDFNNLLMAILGNADLAMSVLDDSAGDLKSYVEEIQRASKRAADLCRQLLAFSGRGRFPMSLVELRPLIAQMLPSLEQVAGSGIRVNAELGDSLPAIKGNPEELRRILKQVVRNAGEAMEEAGVGGEISLRLALAVPGDPGLGRAVGSTREAAGRHLVIEVADRGTGMDAKTRLRLFDPFFTTRGAGRGLGMANVLGSLRAHGGRIAVESAPGEGTTLRIFLPALDPEDPA